MAIDSRIALMGRSPDVGQSINIFENALMNAQTRDIRRQQAEQQAALAPFELQRAEQQAQANERAMQEQDARRRVESIAVFSPVLRPELEKALETGDTSAAQTVLTNRLNQLNRQGLPVDETVDAIERLRNGDTQGVLNDLNVIDQQAQMMGIGAQQQKQFALQSNAPITDPNTGQVSTPVFNPSTGKTELVPVEGAIQETPTQKAEREFKAAQDLSRLSVSETKQKETIKKTVARTSELKKEFSERRRLAARSTRKVKETQKLAQKATQGLAGVGLTQLARVFPGIDAKDEGALSGAFKSLALDELQKFKGPTTDFEFAVTEDIAGSLGSGASANVARLASLERANWFADRESQQFNQHIKAGHDPDEFFFNFNELVTPKKGGKSYSLQSLQDTAVANHISIDEVIKRLSK